eukprot:7875126-Prorocentrum_lima.AAC.1
MTPLSLGRKIEHRCSSLTEAVFRARLKLRDGSLTYAARVSLVHALIVSRLLYGAESWPLLLADQALALYPP